MPEDKPMGEQEIRVAEAEEDYKLERQMSRALKIACKLVSSERERILLAITIFNEIRRGGKKNE